MQLLVGIIGALIGAAALIAAGVLAESYKRNRDRRSTASAIAGEISTLIAMVKRRRHVEMFDAAKKRLDSGQSVTIRNVVGTGLDGTIDPVAERHIERLGLLSESGLPERIVTFYTNLRGIRIDIVNLAKGAFDDNLASKANIIGEDLAIWAETETLGNQLCDELRRIAQEQWWLESKLSATSRAIKKLWRRP